MIGYFEGIDSERGIAWRCADSLSLKSFLGYALTETTPDHSTRIVGISRGCGCGSGGVGLQNAVCGNRRI